MTTFGSPVYNAHNYKGEGRSSAGVGVIETQRKIIETVDIDARLKALEEYENRPGLRPFYSTTPMMGPSRRTESLRPSAGACKLDTAPSK